MRWVPLDKETPPEGKALLVRSEEQQIGVGWYKDGALHFKEDVRLDTYWQWCLVTEHGDRAIDCPWE